jgi:hypothetical protein
MNIDDGIIPNDSKVASCGRPPYFCIFDMHDRSRGVAIGSFDTQEEAEAAKAACEKYIGFTLPQPFVRTERGWVLRSAGSRYTCRKLEPSERDGYDAEPSVGNRIAYTVTGDNERS